MPCLFFEGIPEETKFHPDAVVALYTSIASAVGLPVGKVEVHISNIAHKILKLDGSLVPAPDVHVHVDWHPRPLSVRDNIATTVHMFLVEHGFRHSDLTFRDSGPDSFFVDGVLVFPPVSRGMPHHTV